jgi:catechol 2,3-dioxygenase-like lactoylglutathione lyase family enzyme
VISTLLGHAQVDMALVCLGSLLAYAAEPVRLRLHDDGTLTEEDRARLAAGLAEPDVVPRAEAEARLEEHLASRPATRALRRTNPLGLKLVDAALLAPGERLLFCDADVLFFRPFSGLWGREGEAVFLRDTQNAYSVRSWQMLREPRLRLAGHVNTGIVGFPRAAYDPDLLEWYLAHPASRRTPVWVEQTAWALLGGHTGCRFVDPARVRLVEEEDRAEVPEEVVALHFVSPRRALLPVCAERARDRRGEPPVVLQTVPAPRCSWWSLAGTEIRRRLARW